MAHTPSSRLKDKDLPLLAAFNDKVDRFNALIDKTQAAKEAGFFDSDYIVPGKRERKTEDHFAIAPSEVIGENALLRDEKLWADWDADQAKIAAEKETKDKLKEKETKAASASASIKGRIARGSGQGTLLGGSPGNRTVLGGSSPALGGQ